MCAVVGVALGVFGAAVMADGTGEFVDSGQLIGAEIHSSVVLGDVDNDGDLDAIVDAYLQSVRVWFNQGDGTFSEQGLPIVNSLGQGGLLLADFNNDGNVDLYGAQIGVWFNDGAGNFSQLDENINIAINIFQTPAAGDLDGDGDIDLFVCLLDGLSNTPVFNDGDGLFTLSNQRNGPTARAVSLGDLDGDGDLDAFLSYALDSNRVLFNDGAGRFSDTGQLLGNARSNNAKLGDFDADGDLDAFVMNAGNPVETDPANRIWINDGQGFFTDSGQRLGESASTNGQLADVDDDGDLDAINASYFGPLVEVWFNDGEGGFTPTGQVFDNHTPRFGIDTGDLDGDDDPDVFLAVVANPNLVLLNMDAEDCPADIDDDGNVGASDLLVLLAAWGSNPGGPPDFDGDGNVGASDLLALLVNWGPCP